MKNKLITDIIDNQINFWADNDLSDKYINLIIQNLNEYKSKIIDDIYPNNSWIKNNNIIKRICLNTSNLINENYQRTSFFDRLYGKKVTILDLISFKCLKTKRVGYTFLLNNSDLIHPFHETNHKFQIIDIDHRGVNYKCDICDVLAVKLKSPNRNENIIGLDDNIFYSCEENIIRKIIE